MLNLAQFHSGILKEFLRLGHHNHGMKTSIPATGRILVIDDEENISFLISSALGLLGHEVRTSETGRSGVNEALTFKPHVIILDVMLPDIDGFEVLRQLRQHQVKSPVLFLTARGTTGDRVRGLTTGGDDYIVKPFALEELTARVQVNLRRAGLHSVAVRHEVDDLILDDDEHSVWKNGVEINLSATEFKLLRCLMINSGKVVTRAQILDHVWQYDFGGNSAIIESFISNLRKKVDLTDTKLIHTVRGIGYTIKRPK